MATIFSRILAGEVPCERLYEDARVLAFLDIAPLSPGHTLLIPKVAAPTLAELPEDDAAALGRALPRLCRALVAATGCRDYNVLQNNGRAAHQEVMHVHFHVIPKPGPAAGLGIQWPSGALTADAGALAARVRAALGAGGRQAATVLGA